MNVRPLEPGDLVTWRAHPCRVVEVLPDGRVLLEPAGKVTSLRAGKRYVVGIKYLRDHRRACAE